MKCVKFVATLLLIIGALNWGLVGFFKYDLVASIFGGMDTTSARVIYALIGIAGLCSIRCLTRCGSSGGGCGSSCKCNSSGNCCKK